MITQEQLTIRPAETKDRSQLANMIHFETFVHRHLDWRSPIDWIGHAPYYVAESDNRIIASLACPPDPPGVAWVRMFVCSQKISAEDSWEKLWPQVEEHLRSEKVNSAAAIPIQKWFRILLENNGFQPIHNVIVFAWDNHTTKLPESKPVKIRKMREDELTSVQKIDEAAFGSIWRHSLDSVELAFSKSVFAAVAGDQEGLIGFQISTPTTYGAHLARLAVHPRAQNQGVGYALLKDLQSNYEGPLPKRLSVNTQDHNKISIALYEKAGFIQTNEAYPVYQYNIEV